MCRYSTSGRGLAGMVGLGGRLDLMILVLFSNLNDSVILNTCHLAEKKTQSYWGCKEGVDQPCVLV